MSIIALQATIGGLSAISNSGGETVYGVLDVPTGMLLVDRSKTVEAGTPEKRGRGCAVVTNNGNSDDFDLLFTGDDLRGAIADYFSFAGRGLLTIEDAQQRHNPATKIEPDGVDEHGPKYRIHNDISNGQIAVIVLCWFALRQAGFARQLSAFDEYADLEVTSIGIPASGKTAVSYAMGGRLPIGRDGWPV